MSKYLQLRNQIQKLQKEADMVRERERSETIVRIKEAVAAYELTAQDLGLADANIRRYGHNLGGKPASSVTVSTTKRRGRPSKKTAKTPTGRVLQTVKKLEAKDKRSVVAPKYRDFATGNTWTGRGKQPKWLAAAIQSGKKLEDFKI